jgi:hypothetical protein
MNADAPPIAADESWKGFSELHCGEWRSDRHITPLPRTTILSAAIGGASAFIGDSRAFRLS